jgi:hypothetical protein
MPYKNLKDRLARQRWRYRNTRTEQDRLNDNARRRKSHRERIKWLNAQRAPCVICGESEPCCIDFHHKPGTTKVTEVSTLARRTFNKALLQEEIDKCVCLCSNCHRKVHAGLIDL